MPGAFLPQLQILPPAQQCLWSALKPAPALGFTLYGGTAIALRLGHRTSVDFDFFSERPLQREALQQTFSFMNKATVLQDAPNTLSLIVTALDTDPEPVKLSFFGGIDIGRVGEPDRAQDNGVQIASSVDLLATKLKVMLQRIEAKDYRDIPALIANKIDLAAAKALYGNSFQPSESLKALVYFEGGDLSTLNDDEKSLLINAASQVRDLPNVGLASQQLTQNVTF